MSKTLATLMLSWVSGAVLAAPTVLPSKSKPRKLSEIRTEPLLRAKSPTVLGERTDGT